MRELYHETFKAIKKEFEENLKKENEKDQFMLVDMTKNIVMTILSKLLYNLNAIPIQSQTAFIKNSKTICYKDLCIIK